MTLDETLRLLVETQPFIVLGILFFSAMIEYLFPPFPGDTVTLAGAVLVSVYDFPLLPMFAAVLVGGLIGALADYLLGLYLSGTSDSPIARLRPTSEAMDRVAKAFARHGEAYIVINRFLPGVRAFLFVAAGLARMRLLRVMFFAFISALAWNTLLVAAGMALGANLDALETLFRRYSLFAWSAVFVFVIVVAVRAWRKKSKGKQPQS